MSHTQLVIERPKIQLSLESKVYAGLFLLILSFIVGVLLVSFLVPEKPLPVASQNSTLHKLNGTSSMKRLPLLIDRVVRDSSAYVYVKHASIRSELGIPWGKKIGLEEKSNQTLELKGYK
ncbi:MAG: hypothetical protein KAH03_07850 [Cocleimonas sp.]|nr:hypothetical protein [Cocleimonas sp.]